MKKESNKKTNSIISTQVLIIAFVVLSFCVLIIFAILFNGTQNFLFNRKEEPKGQTIVQRESDSSQDGTSNITLIEGIEPEVQIQNTYQATATSSKSNGYSVEMYVTEQSYNSTTRNATLYYELKVSCGSGYMQYANSENYSATINGSSVYSTSKGNAWFSGPDSTIVVKTGTTTVNVGTSGKKNVSFSFTYTPSDTSPSYTPAGAMTASGTISLNHEVVVHNNNDVMTATASGPVINSYNDIYTNNSGTYYQDGPALTWTATKAVYTNKGYIFNSYSEDTLKGGKGCWWLKLTKNSKTYYRICL